MALFIAPPLPLRFRHVDDGGPRVPAARVAGVALIALALACRPAGQDEVGRTPGVAAGRVGLEFGHAGGFLRPRAATTVS